ncbi:5342_t:CDS:1, partial [Gigaspora rosea]
RALCPGCQQIAQCLALGSTNSKPEGSLLVEFTFWLLEAPEGQPLVPTILGSCKLLKVHQ